MLHGRADLDPFTLLSQAPACTMLPTSTNSKQDASGRLWGYASGKDQVLCQLIANCVVQRGSNVTHLHQHNSLHQQQYILLCPAGGSCAFKDEQQQVRCMLVLQLRCLWARASSYGNVHPMQTGKLSMQQHAGAAAARPWSHRQCYICAAGTVPQHQHAQASFQHSSCMPRGPISLQQPARL